MRGTGLSADALRRDTWTECHIDSWCKVPSCSQQPAPAKHVHSEERWKEVGALTAPATFSL